MTIAMSRQNHIMNEEPEGTIIPGVHRAVSLWSRMSEEMWSSNNATRRRTVTGIPVTGDITLYQWKDIIPEIMGSQTVIPMMKIIFQERIQHLISPCEQAVLNTLSTVRESYDIQVFSECDRKWLTVDSVDDSSTAYVMIKSFSSADDWVRVRSVLS